VSLCELEATGIFGWLDIAAWMLGSACLGAMATGWLLKRLHRIELLAAREVGRWEGRR
jgi:hypothetical protein